MSNTKSLSVPALGGEQSLNRYLAEFKKYPVLTAEQEYMLAKRYAEHEDPEAAAQLVSSHLRLVAKIAMGYRGYGLPQAEVISEANVGLMQAVKRFDPERGFRLATYAMWWIRASIQEYILRSWSLVKLGTTSAQKKLFIKTYGCQMNVYDSERMAEALGGSGYVETATPEDADMILLNTCHIRAQNLVLDSLRYCRKNLRRWMKPQRRKVSVWFKPELRISSK